MSVQAPSPPSEQARLFLSRLDRLPLYRRLRCQGGGNDYSEYVTHYETTSARLRIHRNKRPEIQFGPALRGQAKWEALRIHLFLDDVETVANQAQHDHLAAIRLERHTDDTWYSPKVVFPMFNEFQVMTRERAALTFSHVTYQRRTYPRSTSIVIHSPENTEAEIDVPDLLPMISALCSTDTFSRQTRQDPDLYASNKTLRIGESTWHFDIHNPDLFLSAFRHLMFSIPQSDEERRFRLQIKGLR